MDTEFSNIPEPQILIDVTNLETSYQSNQQTQSNWQDHNLSRAKSNNQSQSQCQTKNKTQSQTQSQIQSQNQAPQILLSNDNFETPSTHQILELSEKSNKFYGRKIAYCCNHCEIMLLSRNLMKEHFQPNINQNQISKTILTYGVIFNHAIYATKPNPTSWMTRLVTRWVTKCVSIASNKTFNILSTCTTPSGPAPTG